MELWIRSQDKKRLTRCYDLRIYKAPNEELWVIEDCDDLGAYKTEKRALEVLDEIQKILKPRLIIKDNGKIIGTFEDNIIRQGATYELKELSTDVYEMPKE